jgi:hypothetical protein
MLRPGIKSVITLIAVCTFCTCIDPYVPKLGDYESLLVVDGLVTNEDRSYEVHLTRSFQAIDSPPVYEENATVYVTDDLGNEFHFMYTGNGSYKSDSTLFSGSTGRTYKLHVITGDQDEYESDPCYLQQVPQIDSLYFQKDEQLFNNNTEQLEGVSVYLDSKWTDNDQYYRWSYDETWKFKVPFPKKFDFIYDKNGHDTYQPISYQGRIVPVKEIKEFCWKNNQSGEVTVSTNLNGQAGKLIKQPINFIASEKSDRLLIQYSILVNQYSISKSEYEFWNNLKKVNETTGDILARQPYSVTGNLHNLKNPDERVLGFFKVSGLSQKRIYIYYRDIATMGLPLYSQQCAESFYAPGNFETPCRCPPKTWDDVYWYLSIMDDYIFIRPIYQGEGDANLVKMVFTRPECADCELAGKKEKPDFWTEL